MNTLHPIFQAALQPFVPHLIPQGPKTMATDNVNMPIGIVKDKLRNLGSELQRARKDIEDASAALVAARARQNELEAEITRITEIESIDLAGKAFVFGEAAFVIKPEWWDRLVGEKVEIIEVVR